MTNQVDLFKSMQIHEERLVPYGFVLENQEYRYQEKIVSEQFLVTVWLNQAGQARTEITDCLTNEPYVLHQVPTATGSFVGEVREGYQAVLDKIAAACFEQQVYTSQQSHEIIAYIRATYQDEVEFLWARSPKNGIVRRQDNKKWYVAILTLPKNKLGIASEEPVEIIDLRGQPEAIEQLVDHQTYFPGYHMNKKHWYTICLDGSVPTSEIIQRITESYQLADK